MGVLRFKCLGLAFWTLNFLAFRVRGCKVLFGNGVGRG